MSQRHRLRYHRSWESISCGRRGARRFGTFNKGEMENISMGEELLGPILTVAVARV